MKRTRRTTNRIEWQWLSAVTIMLALLAGILTTDGAKAQTIKKRRPDALAKYVVDISAAGQNRLNSIDEKHEATDRAIQILNGARKNNLVIISESQAVLDYLAVSVAQRIAEGNVPAALADRHVFKLNVEALFQDSKNAQQLINNLNDIIADLSQPDKKAILLIDPVQTLLGPSSAFDGAASRVLRDAIKSGSVQCFGGSTETAFQNNVAREESLEPLFAPLRVDSVADATNEQESVDSNESTSKEEFVGEKIA